MTRKIVIVGGGVIGCSVAWHLAEQQAGDVILVERDRVGSGTTWHSAGNITWKPTGLSDDPVAYMHKLIDRLEAETEQSTGWRRTGRLFMACSSAAMQVIESYHEAALVEGTRGALLEPGEVSAHHPLADPAVLTGAWLNPRSGRVNPADLVAAYVKGFRARGGQVRENCIVDRIEIRNDATTAVITSGGPIIADAVIVCTGLWSRNLLNKNDIGLAHGTVEHFYAIACPNPPLRRETPSFICSERLIYGREEVGGFLVGFFDRDAKVVDVSKLPEPFTFTLLNEDWDQVASYYQAAVELFPALADAPIRQLLNGPESFTPDGHPLVGPVNGVEGLYVACALNSGGVTYSGMVGHMMADWVLEREQRFQPFDCAPGRFGVHGNDAAWADAQMPNAPSQHYLSLNPAR